MPKFQYALEPGAPKRLTVKVGALFATRAEVSFDGVKVDEFQLSEVKKTPRTLRLPEGTVLSLKVTGALTGYAIDVRRDGQPLPGSHTDPAAMVKGGAYTLYTVAALTIVFAILSGTIASETDGVDVTAIIGIGVAAALYAVLGFFASRGSVVAMSIGLVVYAFDAFYALFDGSMVTKTNPAGGLFVRVIIVMFLARGIQGAWQLRKARKAEAAGSLQQAA